MDQEQKPRERSFIRELVPNLRDTKAQVQSAIRIAVVVIVVLIVVLLVLFLIGHRFGISLLTLLEVLALPITVGAAVPLLNWLQKKRELEIADQRAEVDQEIADERRQDDTLQAYLDGMSQLLTDKDRPLHRVQPGDSLSTVARARTLTVLPRLAGERKASVVQFLYEAGLITKNHPILALSGADLSRADLSGADLRETKLGKVLLRKGKRGKALLRQAKLIEDIVGEADLSGANLSYANISGAFKFTNWPTMLVARTPIANEELNQQAQSLEGATMPNGQRYEDWLKSKDREEDGQNE